MRHRAKTDSSADDYSDELVVKLDEIVADIDTCINGRDEEHVVGHLERLYFFGYRLAGYTNLGSHLELVDLIDQLKGFCRDYYHVSDNALLCEKLRDIKPLLSNIRQQINTINHHLSTNITLSSDRFHTEVDALSVALISDDIAYADRIDELFQNFSVKLCVIASPKIVANEGVIDRADCDVLLIDFAIFHCGEEDRAQIKSSLAGLRSAGHLPDIAVGLVADMSFSSRLDAVRLCCSSLILKNVSVVNLIDQINHLVFVETQRQTAFRILVVDQDERSALRFCQSLAEQAMETQRESNVDNIIEAIGEFEPDVILIGKSIPACNRDELAAVVRQVKEYMYISIVSFAEGIDHVEKDTPADEIILTILNSAVRSRQLASLFHDMYAAEQHFKALLQSGSDVIISADDKGNVVFLNEAASRIYGYSCRDILGRSVVNLVKAGGQRLAVKNYLERVRLDAVNGYLAPIEIEVVTKDGISLPVEISAAIWQFNDRNFYTLILREIVERKAAERRLQLTKQDADAANHAKTEFLSHMSHELRTPLNSILGFSQLLLNDSDSVLSERQIKYIEQIAKGGKHLLALITEILDLTKIESGNMQLSIDSIEPSLVIEDALEQLEPLLIEKGLKVISCAPDSITHKMAADNVRIKQVLINLISNAIKYSPSGETIFVHTLMHEENMIRIAVQDHGPGIPQDKQALLFQPFSRLTDAPGTVEGAGIGLTITKKLVELMAGQVGFSSREKQGSTFWFELPIVKHVDREKPRVVPIVNQMSTYIAERGQEFTGDNHKPCIIYIEEKNTNVKLLDRIMADLIQYEVIATQTVKTATELTRVLLPDAIVLALSRLDNSVKADLCLLREQCPIKKRIPIIVLPSEPADESPQHTDNNWGNSGLSQYIDDSIDCLVAPAEVEHIRQAIDKCVGRSAALR